MFRNLLSRMRLMRGGQTELRSDERTQPAQVSGPMLRALLPSCPACHKATIGHSFAQVASTIVNDSNQQVMADLFGVVRQHRWDRLKDFKEWDSTSDNLVVYVIKGKHTDGTIAVVKNTFELYAPNDLILFEHVSGPDMTAIAGQVGLEWEQIL